MTDTIICTSDTALLKDNFLLAVIDHQEITSHRAGPSGRFQRLAQAFDVLVRRTWATGTRPQNDLQWIYSGVTH